MKGSPASTKVRRTFPSSFLALSPPDRRIQSKKDIKAPRYILLLIPPFFKTLRSRHFLSSFFSRRVFLSFSLYLFLFPSFDSSRATLSRTTFVERSYFFVCLHCMTFVVRIHNNLFRISLHCFQDYDDFYNVYKEYIYIYLFIYSSLITLLIREEVSHI